MIVFGQERGSGVNLEVVTKPLLNIGSATLEGATKGVSTQSPHSPAVLGEGTTSLRSPLISLCTRLHHLFQHCTTEGPGGYTAGTETLPYRELHQLMSEHEKPP